jgi:hypothetical protein
MRRLIFLSVALMFFSGPPLFAQTPAGEVSAGWVLLRSLDAADKGLSEFESYPIGFHLGCAGRIADSVGIAGDFGWNRKSRDVDPLALRGLDATEVGDWISKLSFTTFAGGPRFYFGDRVTGFVHALFGGSRRAETFSLLGGEASESHTYFMVQPGGGVDIRLGDAAAVRLQFDYQWRGDSEGTDGRNLRFVIGGAFYLGER